MSKAKELKDAARIENFDYLSKGDYWFREDELRAFAEAVIDEYFTHDEANENRLGIAIKDDIKQFTDKLFQEDKK